MIRDEYVGLSHTAKPARKPTPAPALAESVPQGDETSTDAPSAQNASLGAEAWVGRTIGRYQVTAVLGKGAMGVVLKARDPMIERDVAIKVLADNLANDAVALGRFLAEAKSAGRINHPNVMAIHEVCQEGSAIYLVLEYVAGGSVAEWLHQRGVLSVREATQALIDACQGVEAAHAAGMVHRDLKPANLMRTKDGVVKIADFGLAKTTAEHNQNFTHSGAVVGTPVFMSPEQCESKPADYRSDIYALGATYYCLLTGARPYADSTTVPQLLYAHCHKPVPDPRSVNAAIPAACAQIVRRAMAKAPTERYPSVAAMLAELRAVSPQPSNQTPDPWETRVDAAPTAPVAASASPGHGLPARPHKRLAWRVPAFVGSAMIMIAIGIAITLSKMAVNDGQQLKAAPAAPVHDPVLVGVLHSLSGTMEASEAPVVDAVLFAIDEVNQAGGVLGRPVQAVVADGRSDWPTFAREAERLLTKEKVVTVFGCWTSASRKSVKPIIEANDHLLIYPVQFEGLETSPNIFYLGGAPNQQILPAIDWALKTRRSQRFFLVGTDHVFPHAVHAIIKDHLQRNGGMVAGEAFVPIGSQNLDTVVAAIRKEKPDMILNTINGDANVAFFRALRRGGVTPAETPTLSFCVDEQGLRSLNPSDLKGDFAAWNYFQTLGNPENDAFVRRFRTRFPQRPITDPMATAYTGVKLWAQAVNTAQSVLPKKIRRALVDERLQGPAGEVRIDPDTQYAVLTPHIGEMKNDGMFQVIWSAPAPVRPDPYPPTRSAEAWHRFLHDLYRGWGNRWSAPNADHSTSSLP